MNNLRLIAMALALSSSMAMSLEFEGNPFDHPSIGAHGVGLGGSVFHTWGFSYRHYFSSHWGITANFGGWWKQDSGHIGVAVGGLYNFMHHHFSKSALPSSSIRLYGVGYVAGIIRKGIIYNPEVNRYTNEPLKSFDLGLGVGPGAEFFFTKNIAINLEVPLMAFFSFSRVGKNLKSVHPHLGGGISYYF